MVSPEVAPGAALPTRYPERVAGICGFRPLEKGAGLLAAASPWSRYVENHAALRASGRTLVYVAHEGLGSRLRGVASALLLAMRADRALQIEWEGLDRFLQPNLVNWTDPVTEGTPHECSRGNAMRVFEEADGRPWTRCPRVVLEHWHLLSLPNKPLADLFPQEFSQLREGSRDAYHYMGCAARFLFRPTRGLESALASANSELWHDAPDTQPVVGVQIRFGDLIAYRAAGSTVYGAGDDVRQKPEAETVNAMLQCPAERHFLGKSGGGGAPRLLFASDWAAARRWATNASPQAASFELDPVHMQGLNWQSSSTEAKALAIWAEFFLLARTDALLVSGSRAVTQDLGFASRALFNATGGALGLCRASTFALAAASLGMLPPSKVFYGSEDCGTSCGDCGHACRQRQT